MKYFSPNEIMQFINSTGLQYEDKGDYIKFKCLNPSHDDKNPSMTMLKSNGFTKCWSCGHKYNFVKLYYILTGEKIVRKESSFTSSLSKNKPVAYENRRKVTTYRVESGILYKPKLSPTVVQYLREIGVDDEAIEYFDIRWTDQAKIGFDKKKDPTFIKNRICIPIVEDKRIVNMECRDFTLEQIPKVIYPKGSIADTLFNYDNLKKNETLIVVEGIKSALRIWKYVSKNVTATLGSSIGKRQRQMLNEFKDILLFPDNDDAGKTMITQFKGFYDYDYCYTFMEQEGYDPADGEVGDVVWAINNKISTHTENLKKDYGEEILEPLKLNW